MARARRWRRLPGVVALVLVVAGVAGCAVPRWQGELASTNGAGTDSGDDLSRGPMLSPDGTKVAFISDAADLGPTDTNGLTDVYVRDLTTGTTSLVSVDAAGTDSGNGASRSMSFSSDGSKMLFSSESTDLVSPETTGSTSDLYLRDLVAGTTTLISVNATGDGGGDDNTWAGTLSPDGTKVLFASEAHNLVSPDPGGFLGVYERDLTTGVTTRLAEGTRPIYSPSGDAIAYLDVAGAVRLRTTATGTTVDASAGLPGRSFDSFARPVFSHDGAKLAFERRSSSNPVRDDIYVYDRAARTATLVTVAASGSGGSDNTPSHVWGFDPTNANRLLFSSTARNLVTNDTNSFMEDLFVRNLSAGVTRLVTVRADGGTGSANWHSTSASWLGDGTKIAFVSRADNFGVTDTNAAYDVYVRDETARTYALVSANAAGTNSGTGHSGRYELVIAPGLSQFFYQLSVSPDGTRIAFGSYAGDLGPTDTDRPNDHDIYVAKLVTPP